MTQEDQKLWDRVVATVAPRGFPSGAASIRALAFWERTPTILDLHGMTLNEAHARTLHLIRDAHARNEKCVTVITGLSGPIRREFPFWLEDLSQVRKVDTLNGGGAFKITLGRSKK